MIKITSQGDMSNCTPVYNTVVNVQQNSPHYLILHSLLIREFIFGLRPTISNRRNIISLRIFTNEKL